MTFHYRKTSFGWIGSIVLHVSLAAVFYFSHFQPTIPNIKYIEISLGALPGGGGALPKFSFPARGEPDIASEEEVQSINNPIALPGRTYFPALEEVIHLPTMKKTIPADPSTPLTLSNKPSVGREERRPSYTYSASPGKKESPTGSATGSGNVTGLAPGSGGTGKGGRGRGDGTGDNIMYGLQWVSGGNRKFISGDIPNFPQGINVSAQIKLKVIVLPDGSVRSVAPAQKGETRLENSAIAKVKLWQFEPLLSAQPQVEQICYITFNFKLK